ncbi:MAG: hypothetical protein ACYDEY_04200 [Acidimicrobiales bacterium]
MGWTTPSVCTPEQADRWTWLIVAGYTQLRLARGLIADLRLPWERPQDPRLLTPARVRKGFRRLGAIIGTPAAFFVQFEDDEHITRDVDEAVEAPPAHMAGVLATRWELSVVAAVALTARHDKRIAARIAARCDQPVWLRNAASRIAGRA